MCRAEGEVTSHMTARRRSLHLQSRHALPCLVEVCIGSSLWFSPQRYLNDKVQLEDPRPKYLPTHLCILSQILIIILDRSDLLTNFIFWFCVNIYLIDSALFKFLNRLLKEFRIPNYDSSLSLQIQILDYIH